MAKRDLAKEAYWREAVQRQVASGLSGRRFCRQEELTESAFYAWRRTIRERDAAASGSQRAAFVRLLIQDPPRHAPAIVLALAGGRELRLPASIDVDRLAALVHALEGRGRR